MNYRINRPLVYRLGQDGHHLRLQVGDVVRGVTLSSITENVKEYRKAEARHRRNSPETRLAYFLAHGVVRYAVAVEDLSPTNAPPTIPVERTRVR